MTNRLHRVLTEGKHWPEDYIKTGVNLVKASPLGQQSWYSDNFIQKDMKTFADEFGPLSHKNPNLGFFSTIVKWFIEYSGTSKEKYQEFIERKLDGVIGTLQTILNDPSYDKIKDEIKQKWTFAQFEDLQKKINAEAKASSDEKLKGLVKRDDYDLIPIYSYKELHEKFGGEWTGYNGQSEWCHTNGKSTYESWTKNGTQMFFVLAKRDWQKVKSPKPGQNAYDEYGLSLIAILVDVATGNLLNETLRWNHVIDPSKANPGATVDKAFKNNWGALSQAVGIDVKAACEKECRDLKQKLQKEADAANKRVAEILKGKTEIDLDTIPVNLYSKLTNLVIPNTVTSIEGDVFYGCKGLTSVTIGNSVKSIGSYAFYGCIGLTSMVIGNNVTSIGSSAFRNCSSLVNVTIPDSVTSIQSYAFSGCRDLTHISIGNSVEYLGSNIFFNCINLASVTIPSSVVDIGRFAFNQCNGLKEVVFEGKTLAEVKAMEYYPFGIGDESIIKCERDELMEAKGRKLKSYRRLDNTKVDECDGGGAAAGGDAGGASAGGDAGAVAVDAGDTAGEMAGTSTADVIGTFDPKKGVMGVGNFMVPSKAKVPLYRWEVCNGGSKRKKDKKGKDKKYAYEKGMKVVVSMFEKDGTEQSGAKLDQSKVLSRLKKISKGVKSIDDVKAVEAKIEKDKQQIDRKLAQSNYSMLKSTFNDMCSFIKDICSGRYKASWFAVSMVTVGLIYILSPIDIVPDFIPVVGVIDDVFVLKLIYDAVKDELHRWKAQQK